MTNTTLTGKKVLLLGGSAGIGLATAQAASEEGAIVTIVSSNKERIDKALTSLPASAKGIVADLSKTENIQQLFTEIEDIDHLVYTAGEHLIIGNIDATDIAQARQFFNVRYWGAYAAAKYGHSKINNGGSIIFSSGAAGRKPQAGWSLGASICSAMEGLTRALAVELAPIRVNCVVPGLVKTDLWANIPKETLAQLFASFESSLPVKHIADAPEVAQSYIHLMKQTYMTGQSIVVDGGGLLM